MRGSLGAIFIILVSLTILMSPAIATVTWSTRENRDYGSNDLSELNDFSLTDCLFSCEFNPKCIGVVVDYSDSSGPGKCWLKSAFSNSSIKNGQRYTYKLTRS